MKWNILVAMMVLGLGTQSFGFELMDRMLGEHGKGHPCQKAGVDPCAHRPLLGLLGGNPIQRHCDAKCGDVKGGDAKHPCAQRPGLGLLNGLHVQRHCDTKTGTKTGTKDAGTKHACPSRPGLGLLGGLHAQRHGATKNGKDGTKTDAKHACPSHGGLGLGLLGGRHVQRACDDKGTKTGTKTGTKHACPSHGGLGLGLLGGHHVQRACDDKGTKTGTKTDAKHACPSAGGLLGGQHVQRACDDKGTKGTKHPQRCGGLLGLGLLGQPCPTTAKTPGKTPDKTKADCAPRRGCGPTLLERIFACRPLCCHDGKGAGKTAKGGGTKAPKADVGANEVPMPPAPVVDPSAFRHTPRPIIHASTRVVN